MPPFSATPHRSHSLHSRFNAFVLHSPFYTKEISKPHFRLNHAEAYTYALSDLSLSSYFSHKNYSPILMKDMPFFLLKNSLGAKMKKGIKTFCNNNGSTSTLNQQNSHNNNSDFTSKVSSSNSPTLEDLILQLELEEEMARKAKLNNNSKYSGIMRGRMSCVNNSDILRSARNALNQYPRFSLDGRDAMYRSSFGNIEGRRSVCSEISLGGEEENDLDNNNNHKGMCFLPPTLAGESVVWRKPGVVAKLMGLEAMPVPIGSSSNKEKLSAIVRRQNLIRRRFERHDLERKLLTMEMQRQSCGYHNNNNNNIRRHTKNNNGCSKNGYCVMKPVALEALAGGPGRRSYA